MKNWLKRVRHRKNHTRKFIERTIYSKSLRRFHVITRNRQTGDMKQYDYWYSDKIKDKYAAIRETQYVMGPQCSIIFAHEYVTLPEGRTVYFLEDWNN